MAEALASGKARPVPPVFNRAPLAAKPYAELPLGAIEPRGWLRDELERMAAGMTGHLDQWYPEVAGPRNAWLGGDGDTWERGPYWIDGLYPLAHLLGDEALLEKALPWIEWTLANQRENGQIGPRDLAEEDRDRPPPPGAQTIKPDDWWPRMVMLKILQQHYLATGDERVIDCLTRYFRFQLAELPARPLHDPDNEDSGSWWAAQRGGENLLVVLWLYNLTGENFLLELADLIHEQTVPVTDWFTRGPENRILHRADRVDVPRPMMAGAALHCVNLAQMMKTPAVRWQQDRDPARLAAIEQAFADIRTFHGQPHGLYGGDEGLHGNAPDRGSELCTAVEMMFSLEKMFEITGAPAHGDRLDRIAFNALPTQTTDDYRGRQYFQQTNQVQATFGDRDFFEDKGDRVVFGLLNGYPCCTANLHQGWPKFTQHLWLASRDGGLAALSYAPSAVTAVVGGDGGGEGAGKGGGKVANGGGGQEVTLAVETGYPFKERTAITISTEAPVTFPLHLRIPGWAENARISVNGKPLDGVKAGTMHVIERRWRDGDTVRLRFPMRLRTSVWHERSRAVERGPLVYALDIEGEKRRVSGDRPEGVPDSAPDRGYLEVLPISPWNYALPGPVVHQPGKHTRLEIAEDIPDNPWTPESAPVRIRTRGVRLNYWKLDRHSASPPPLSPAERPGGAQLEEITLIPYGASTLRIAAFPWVRWPGTIEAPAEPGARKKTAPQARKKPASGDDRPNFVFVLTDDISPDDLGIYGNEAIRTPNLDRLAERGLVFDKAYVTTSSCSPSRCSIITGRYPHNTGAPELHMPLPPGQVTFVQKLREAGYHTVLSGKNHMTRGAEAAARLGFDRVTDSKPSGSENWIEHLRKRPRDRPFFLWFASHDAHHAWQINDKAPVYEPDEVEVPPFLVDGPRTRGELAQYYHEVSRTDHYVGEILKELEAQGIADNTWFLYTSDNGRPFPRSKTYLYDSGIKTPLIVVGPGVESGQRTASLASTIDLAPTFLELSGLPVPETVQGVSLVPVLRDPAATVRDFAFAERNWHVYRAHERAVRSGRWLYIRNAWPEKPNLSGESTDGDRMFPAASELWERARAGKLTPAQALLTQVPQPSEMLFDVEADPHQLVDLAGYPENEGRLERLRGLLDRWTEETGDSVPENPTPTRPLGVKKTPPRGDVPGEKRRAAEIRASGPVKSGS